MSLLLDALKRAEQEKLARQPAGASPPAGGRSHAAAPASGLELQPMASANAPQAAQAAPGSRPEAAAQAAQNVFKAKSDPDGESTRNRAMLWVTVAAVAIVAIAAAGYVWYTVKGLTPQ
ncbi:MAG TPA: hypothetical protein VFV90_05680, partial [Usitatibacter sp.]|nr:hypothetical protein [Usitatibacter sp.]